MALFGEADDGNNVRVCVRVRPLLGSELERGDGSNMALLPDQKTVRVSVATEGRRKIESQHYVYDKTFATDASQIDVFHQSGVESYCDAALDGFAATVFCFGQTGSGKTFTMSGPASVVEECHREDAPPGGPVDHHLLGLQYRAAYYAAHAADVIRSREGSDAVTLRASFIEIYNEHVNDLLNDTHNLKVRWSQQSQSFFVEQLMIVRCDNIDDILSVLAEGAANRKRAAHNLNDDSSRSHVIFTIYVERVRVPPGSTVKAPPSLGKINFVDLAGSERLRDSGSEGVNAIETRSINKSLFALGNVIASLSSRNEATFVPYRDSNLTRLLMDSLGGSCRTLMVACVTPSAVFTDESVSTLKYATRTRSIANAIPTVRMDPKQQAIYELRVEVETLKAENESLRQQLQRATGQSGGTPLFGVGAAHPHTPATAPDFGNPYSQQPSVPIPPSAPREAEPYRGLQQPQHRQQQQQQQQPLQHTRSHIPSTLPPPPLGAGNLTRGVSEPIMNHQFRGGPLTNPFGLAPAALPPSPHLSPAVQHAVEARMHADNARLRDEVSELRNLILQRTASSGSVGGGGLSSVGGSVSRGGGSTPATLHATPRTGPLSAGIGAPAPAAQPVDGGYGFRAAAKPRGRLNLAPLAQDDGYLGVPFSELAGATSGTTASAPPVAGDRGENLFGLTNQSNGMSAPRSVPASALTTGASPQRARQQQQQQQQSPLQQRNLELAAQQTRSQLGQAQREMMLMRLQQGQEAFDSGSWNGE